ncbi:MAG: hypothetical protein RLZZ71_934 [Bacteroidota bacterium]|jgi:serine/threonine protein kinase
MTSSGFNAEENSTALTSEVIFTGENFVITRKIYFHQFRIEKKAVASKRRSPVLISALRREFNIGLHLKHPNIVSYFFLHDRAEEGLVIEMEFIDGKNLKQFIEGNNIKNKNGAKIISGILRALNYLHSKEIFHLDLKPENIMISNLDGQVKLIDFSHSSTSTHIKSWGSSTHYSAPELHNQKCSAKSDVYSLGKIIEYLQENEAIPKTRLWNSMVKKCTQNNTRDRFQNISEIELVLRNVRVRRFSFLSATAVLVGILSILLLPKKEVTSDIPQAISMTTQQSKPIYTVETDQSMEDEETNSNIKSAPSNLKTTLSVADSLAIENTVRQFFNRYKNRMETLAIPSLSSATSIHQEEYTLLLKEWNTFTKQFQPESSGSISSQRIYQNALYRNNIEIGKLNTVMIK